MPTKQPKKKDSWREIGMELISTPNGCPYHYIENPQPGRQCLLCYRSARGKRVRHSKDCVWVRARALRRSERRRK